MKMIPILLTLALLQGCLENTRDRRAAFSQRTNQNSSGHGYPSNQPTGGSIVLPGGSDKSDDADDETNLGGSGTPQIPEEISHCTWATDGVNGFALNHAHLGPFNICQGKNSDTEIHIQIKNPITDAQLCIFPTYHSSSASVYIGEARCFIASNPKTVYKVNLLKNRPNYGQFNVTGVMVMKDKAYFYPAPFYQYVLSPDAYLFCSQFLDTYQDPSYCQAFRSVGQYVYHQF